MFDVTWLPDPNKYMGYYHVSQVDIFAINQSLIIG